MNILFSQSLLHFSNTYQPLSGTMTGYPWEAHRCDRVTDVHAGHYIEWSELSARHVRGMCKGPWGARKEWLTAEMELGSRGWRADMEGDHFCCVLLPSLALVSTERSSIYSKFMWPISRSQTRFCSSISVTYHCFLCSNEGFDNLSIPWPHRAFDVQAGLSNGYGVYFWATSDLLGLLWSVAALLTIQLVPAPHLSHSTVWCSADLLGRIILPTPCLAISLMECYNAFAPLGTWALVSPRMGTPHTTKPPACTGRAQSPCSLLPDSPSQSPLPELPLFPQLTLPIPAHWVAIGPVVREVWFNACLCQFSKVP